MEPDAWNDALEEIKEKTRNLLGNMLDTHFAQIMETLGEVVDDNNERQPGEALHGTLPVQFTVAFGHVDGSFEIDGRILFERKVRVKDTFDTIKVNPNQPELELGGEEDVAGETGGGDGEQGEGSGEEDPAAAPGSPSPLDH